MVRIEFRVPGALLALALIACGSSEPDFSHPPRGGSDSGGAASGGSGGSVQGGAGAMQGGGAGTASGGAAGSAASGGSSGAAPIGGTSGSASGGSSGAGSTQFECGPLRCFTSQQWCRITQPAMSGGSTQYMCQPFPDSCSAYDCNCVCQHSACESSSACPCVVESGGVTVTCGP